MMPLSFLIPFIPSHTFRQPMSLPPQYSAHRISGTAEARHTLELYLDYVCPFSAKLWNQVYHHVLPWLEKEHPGQVQVHTWGPRSSPDLFSFFVRLFQIRPCTRGNSV